MTGVAWAAEAVAPSSGMGSFAQFIPLILIFGVFFFLMIRPQQKRAKAHQMYLGNLKKGDKVITSGGLHGQITGMTDSVITLEIAENVRVKINRGAIAGSASTLEKQPAPAKTGG